MSKQVIMEAFELFDTDGDGLINLAGKNFMHSNFKMN